MNSRKQRKMQMITGFLALAMVVSMLTGLAYGKQATGKSPEQEIYEDGAVKIGYNGVINVPDFLLMMLTKHEWAKSIDISEDKDLEIIPKEDGNGLFVIHGLFQKLQPGIINLYEQIGTMEVVIEGERFKLTPTLGTKTDKHSLHTYNSGDETDWSLYVELPESYKEQLDNGFTLEMTLGNKELMEKDEDIKTYRLVYEKEKE